MTTTIPSGTTPPTSLASLFVETLRGARTDRVPAWFMRQAGRYLPEYRALKDRYSFWQLASEPDLAAEVTLQPVRRYPLDAAVIFTDIMVPACTLGVDVDFTPGPVIAPLRDERDIARLRVPSPEEVAPFLAEAIRLVAAATDVPVIGHAGAPLTFCSYLVTGRKSNDHLEFRTWLQHDPALAHRLLRIATDTAVSSLRMQADAGASVLQLFDSWVGLHDPATYREFGLPYVAQVFRALADLDVPCIYYAPQAAHLHPQMRCLPVDAFGIDWRTSLPDAATALGTRRLQGNLDPAVLFAGEKVVRRRVRALLEEGADYAHVFNVGAGLLPQTPVDSISWALDTVAEYNAG